MVRRYYGTKILRKSSPTSLVLYLDKTWGFGFKDRVRIRARDIDDSDASLLCTIKNVSRVGNSLCIYIPSEWGFSAGDMLVFSVEHVGPEERSDTDGSITDDISDGGEPEADDDA